VIILIDLPTIVYFLFFRSRSLIKSARNSFTVRSTSSTLNSFTVRSIRISIRRSSASIRWASASIRWASLRLSSTLSF
jgi:hypothetical protein